VVVAVVVVVVVGVHEGNEAVAVFLVGLILAVLLLSCRFFFKPFFFSFYSWSSLSYVGVGRRQSPAAGSFP